MTATNTADIRTGCQLARDISTITVAIAPGPASIGIAIGKIAMSSPCVRLSSRSSFVERVGDGCARIMSIDIKSSMIPPATLNAPSEMPKALNTRPPVIANRIRITQVANEARSATLLRCSEVSAPVIDRNTGTFASGSMTKKIALNATTANLASSSVTRPVYHGSGSRAARQSAGIPASPTAPTMMPPAIAHVVSMSPPTLAQLHSAFA